MSDFEAPKERKEDGPRGDTVITHPAFAQIRASRVSGHALLYGSDFRHQHFITISINRSQLRRGLSKDWHSAKNEMIEVMLSEAQWATFISTLNSGSGSPCTLNHIGMERVPQIPYVQNRRKQFGDEVKETLAIVQQSLDRLREQIESTNLSGKQKKVLTDTVGAAERNLSPNLDFVGSQFREHMEETVERGKVELEAYAQATIQRAGIAAIANTSAVQLIDQKDDV